MSIFGPSPKKPHVPPVGTDDIFLGQLEYESHLAKASVWLHKLIIHRIRDIDAKLCPISKLLDQEDGRLCTRLRYYCRKIKEYPPHKAPPDIVKRDHRAAKILLKRLEELLENPEHVLEARRHVNALECLATSSPDGKLSPEEYARSIDKTRDDIIDAFGKIGADFKKQERGDRGEQRKQGVLIKKIDNISSGIRKSHMNERDILRFVSDEPERYAHKDGRNVNDVKSAAVYLACTRINRSPLGDERAIGTQVFNDFSKAPGFYQDFDSFMRQVRRKSAEFRT